MFLNVNVLLIILSYRCLIISSLRIGMRNSRSDVSSTSVKGPNDCIIMVPRDGYRMPIPLATSSTNVLSVIYPNEYGMFFIKNTLKLSCAGGVFTSPISREFHFFEIPCVNKSLVYKGKRYEFDAFKCRNNPNPTKFATQNMCQDVSNRIYEVGFKTKFGFKILYKICFDIMTKNPLFSWYFVDPSIHKYRQDYFVEPIFKNTHFESNIDLMNVNSVDQSFVKRKTAVVDTNVQDKIDVMEVYQNQTDRLEELLESKEMVDNYINKHYDYRRYLVPCNLISKMDFVYMFQQSATYYYENAVPQWFFFSEDIWSEVEKLFHRNLVNSNSSSTHLIAAGTYDVSTLADSSGRQRKIYLNAPRNMPVPKYIWKMDYDLGSKTGIVYIALCNPYTSVEETGYICDTMPCPGIERLSAETRKVVYCCSKESFVHTFKEFDDIVYEKF